MTPNKKGTNNLIRAMDEAICDASESEILELINQMGLTDALDRLTGPSRQTGANPIMSRQRLVYALSRDPSLRNALGIGNADLQEIPDEEIVAALRRLADLPPGE